MGRVGLSSGNPSRGEKTIGPTTYDGSPPGRGRRLVLKTFRGVIWVGSRLCVGAAENRPIDHDHSLRNTDGWTTTGPARGKTSSRAATTSAVLG